MAQVAHVGVRRAAELGALAGVLAAASSAVSTMRVTVPGIASRLPPSCGTQKLWMTSARLDLEAHRAAGREVELVRGGHARDPGTGTPTTTGGRSRLTRRASFGGAAWVRKIAATVGKAMNVRMTAGMTVHASSSDRVAAYLPGDRLRVALPEPEDRDQEEHLHHQEDRGVPPEDLEEDPVARSSRSRSAA